MPGFLTVTNQGKTALLTANNPIFTDALRLGRVSKNSRILGNLLKAKFGFNMA
jgi:hypothetical protein